MVDALLLFFRRATKIRLLLCPRLSLDLCACLGVGLGETRPRRGGQSGGVVEIFRLL